MIAIYIIETSPQYFCTMRDTEKERDHILEILLRKERSKSSAAEWGTNFVS